MDIKDIKLSIIVLLIVLIFYFLFINQNKNDKINLHKDQKNIIEEYSSNRSISNKIKKDHEKCPVTNMRTHLTGCVHYPPLNRGFIISTSNKPSMLKIQQSFKKADNEYKIESNILYHKNKKKQEVLDCSVINIQSILPEIKTKLL